MTTASKDHGWPARGREGPLDRAFHRLAAGCTAAEKGELFHEATAAG